MIKLQDLIEKISTDNDIPKGQVRKIANLFSNEIIKAIESDEGITSGRLGSYVKTLKAREATEDKPEQPERKVLIIRIKSEKVAENDQDAYSSDSTD